MSNCFIKIGLIVPFKQIFIWSVLKKMLGLLYEGVELRVNVGCAE